MLLDDRKARYEHVFQACIWPNVLLMLNFLHQRKQGRGSYDSFSCILISFLRLVLRSRSDTHQFIFK